MQEYIAFDALGTHWRVELARKPTDTLRTTLLDEVHRFEAAYSRFLDDSLLSRLNDDKSMTHAPKEFVDLLSYGLDAYEKTNGVFNMSVGATLEATGYGRSPEKAARLSSALTDDVQVVGDTVTIAPHLRLDFGGFGKGWLIDRLGRLLRDAAHADFIINGGGDMLVGDSPVPLLIEHPTMPGQAIGTVTVAGASLASSSAQKRRWKDADDVVHTHIPATDALQQNDMPISVHVLAKNATSADMLATTGLLMSSSERRRLLHSYNATLLEVFPVGTYRHTAAFPFKPFQH